MMQLRATGIIQTPGLLAMHSTGAGKTLLTLCALIAFWNLNSLPGKVATILRPNDIISDPIPIFIISVKSNQQDNGLLKLAHYGMTFFEEFEDLTVPQDSPQRFPFRVQVYPEFVATKSRLIENKRKLFDQARFTIQNEAIVLGRDIPIDDRDKLFETVLMKTNPYQPIKINKVTYCLQETEPNLYLDIFAEPVIQELVAKSISARLRRGFETAIADADPEKLKLLRSRNRDMRRLVMI
jgi:hypothetical protein